MRTILALMIVASITGCATPYEPYGRLGGYGDAHIKDNIYYISVIVNLFTSQTTASEYFHRRAKDLCLEEGYEGYRVYPVGDPSIPGLHGFAPAGYLNPPLPGETVIVGYVACLGPSEFRAPIEKGQRWIPE